MNGTATWPGRMGPREDSPRPAPPPEKLPPREPVTPVKLRSTLKKVFGLRALRPGQAEVIERVLAGRSTLAVMPTGAGKSLCYQLPAVLSDALTVVISPLIALMKDQCDALQQRGVAAVQLNSALDANRRLENEALLSRGAVRIVFTTPERLADARTLDLLQSQRVGLLVVDEAHCIAQWGHDFRPAFGALRDVRRALGRPPVLALTATASAPVQREIAEALDIPRDGILCHGVYRPNLRLAVELPETEKQRREFMLRRLQALQGSAIVYCATVREATSLQRQLREAGMAAGLYHGKLAKGEREAAQEAFMRDECRVMVATNAFGMGIDKPDIRLVMHAQMPASIEAYVQECGRAGRDGEPADCVLLFREGDRALQQFFTGGHVPSREELASVWRALASHTPQGGWLPAALAEVARLPQRRLDQVLAALRSVRAVRSVGGHQAERGLKPATRREARAVVEAAEAALQQRQQKERDGLAAMVLYAKAGHCRWAGVLAHFGATLADGAARCGHCDSCERFAALQAAERDVEPGSDMQPTRQRAFEPGQRVRVRRFGWGEVQDCSADAVTILFPRHGLRQIHPDFVLGTARAA